MLLLRRLLRCTLLLPLSAIHQHDAAAMRTQGEAAGIDQEQCSESDSHLRAPRSTAGCAWHTQYCGGWCRCRRDSKCEKRTPWAVVPPRKCGHGASVVHGASCVGRRRWAQHAELTLRASAADLARDRRYSCGGASRHDGPPA